ncbi:ComF family protein [Streptomyces sp. NPDC002888]|uniref:ComF family protein n=1 Tax=Streptomyces sp. NPDC002888 TaxID=3364668 RepID=UPI00368B7A30
MRGLWRDLTDLVLPAECGGCGRPRTVLCPECRAALDGAVPRRVRPVPEPPGLPVVHAAARYGDAVRAVLLAHKERGALALAGPLGTALAGAVRAGFAEARARTAAGAVEGVSGEGTRAHEGTGGTAIGCVSGSRPGLSGHGGRARSGGSGDGVLLVPVPSARAVVRARGQDSARRIALAAAAELRRAGTPARVLAVLRQRRTVADQSGLNSRQRLDNLAGALAVAPGGARLLSGGRVVLVDDLMTTGASLAEAARAVRAATAWCRTETGSRSNAYGGEAESVSAGVDVVRPVYAGVAWESRRERMADAVEGGMDRAGVGLGMAGVTGGGDVIRAAVVAATPDSFEMNWN